MEVYLFNYSPIGMRCEHQLLLFAHVCYVWGLKIKPPTDRYNKKLRQT